MGPSRHSATEGSEPTLALISTIPQGELAQRGLAGPLPDLLPGALWGLLREQGLRTVQCSCEDLLQPGGARYRGVILCGNSPLAVVSPLMRLRRHPDTALLPLIVYLHRDEADFAVSPPVEWLRASWARYADAVVESDSSPAEAAAALQRLRRIAAAVAALPAPLSASLRSQRLLLLLRTLLTRGIVSLQPERDPHQPLCHAYPPLEAIGGELLQADIELLCRLGLLERTFFDRVCVCPGCGDARLLFREVCAACLSPDVRRGEVIHHYRCGHVAQEPAFWRRGELVCPACCEPLRHIGIDYERPAALLHCHSCEQLAAEGTTQARCLGCGQSYLADRIGERVVWSYLLTQEGRAAAACGQVPAVPSIDEATEGESR
ncbi:MAG: hypothetical protein NZ890_09420 [Myxococcota bacterium]|nr:hypothetical protein [Myxococcota bacterium]